MKNIPQNEFDFGSEPFRLVSEAGTDTERQREQEQRKRQNRTEAAKAQWWFQQMHKAVDD